MPDQSILQTSFRLGSLELANRIVMAPLTRNRATPDTLAPNDLIAKYYCQRASAGLIITEATQISQQGQGYLNTPGIYSPEQVEGWKKVTQAVHAEGGKIYLQLWHVGRVSHVSLQPNGGAPVAPSAILAKTKTYLAQGFAEVSAPRALEAAEIPGIVQDYFSFPIKDVDEAIQLFISDIREGKQSDQTFEILKALNSEDLKITEPKAAQHG